MSDDRAWLVAYDVCDRRRLIRVHRRMCEHAVAIEYSVFWLTGSPADRLRCVQQVLPLLDPSQDDLRMYAVPARGFRQRIGAAALPEGIVWSALPPASRWDRDEAASAPPAMAALAWPGGAVSGHGGESSS